MSLNQTSETPGGHKCNVQTIQQHADFLATLPEPPERFIHRDIHDGYTSELHRLRRLPVIEYAGKEETEHKGSKRWTYRLAPWAADALEEILDNRDTICPCGHSGIQNHGGHYECSFEACDAKFARKELEVDE